MFKTKRKRAVVLALIAFFCAATTYVAVDWKRFGGGFLAFLKGRNGTSVASTRAGQSSGSGGHAAGSGEPLPAASTRPSLIALANARRHASGTGGGSGGHKSDEDDLFKYGNPAAGGIPPGSFVVAQNDAPAGGNNGAGTPPAPEVGGPTPGGTGPGVSSPAPAPTSTGGISDAGLPIAKPPAPQPPPPPPPATGTTPPPPTSPPPPTTPVAPPVTTQPVTPSPPTTPPPPADSPAPPPNQAGSTDSNPTGDDPTGGDGSTGSGGSTPPPQGPGSVSTVPEASSLAMMGLGALFLAVAARRKDARNS